MAVCFDAGWVDPGYINRITLEIYNLNKHESVVLPVGERIGQLIFHHTGQVDGGYASGRGGMSGKYQHTDDLDELIKTWRPEMMLPRAFKDNRHKPDGNSGSKRGGFIMMTGSISVGGQKKKNIRIIRKVIDLKVATSVNW